jgi:competence ComEA-like helix-hairpin-helix protein
MATLASIAAHHFEAEDAMYRTTLPVALLIAVLLVPPFPAASPVLPGADPTSADAKPDDVNAGKSGVRGAPKTSPAPPAGGAAPAKVVMPARSGESVNVNSADVKALMTLDGVGRRVAERIVEYRKTHGPFKKPEELRRVEGIGAGLFERNRERIVVK